MLKKGECKLPWCSHNQVIMKCSHKVQFKYQCHKIAQVQLEVEVVFHKIKKDRHTECQEVPEYHPRNFHHLLHKKAWILISVTLVHFSCRSTDTISILALYQSMQRQKSCLITIILSDILVSVSPVLKQIFKFY